MTTVFNNTSSAYQTFLTLHSDADNNMQSNKRWTANISERFSIKLSDEYCINICPSNTHSAFDIASALLKAKTCKTIVINASLTLSETQMLKEMALFSGTVLVYTDSAQAYYELFDKRHTLEQA